MGNTISRGPVRSSLIADRPALRNAGRSAIAQLKLIMLWLAVLLPLVWGALDALKDLRYLFP